MFGKKVDHLQKGGGKDSKHIKYVLKDYKFKWLRHWAPPSVAEPDALGRSSAQSLWPEYFYFRFPNQIRFICGGYFLELRTEEMMRTESRRKEESNKQVWLASNCGISWSSLLCLLVLRCRRSSCIARSPVVSWRGVYTTWECGRLCRARPSSTGCFRAANSLWWIWLARRNKDKLKWRINAGRAAM